MITSRKAYFVDSGAWMGYFNSRDQWHEVLEIIFREISDLQPHLYTTDVVILEFITLARKSGVTVNKIEEWVKSIIASAFVECTLEIDLNDAREILLKYHAISFSGFDSSSVALAARLGINRVLSVDDEFIKCSRFIEVRPSPAERQLVTK